MQLCRSVASSSGSRRSRDPMPAVPVPESAPTRPDAGTRPSTRHSWSASMTCASDAPDFSQRGCVVVGPAQAARTRLHNARRTGFMGRKGIISRREGRMDAAADKLMHDLRNMVAAAEELLASGSPSPEALKEVRDRLEGAGAELEAQVRKHPYAAL